jgi:hypothetical protein
MIGIGTILSVVGGVSEAINIYKFGSTLALLHHHAPAWRCTR